MAAHFTSRTVAILSGVGLLLSSFVAHAEPPKFEEQIRYRQAVMVMLKWHTEKISLQIKSAQTFNRDEALSNALVIEMLSKLAMEGFVSGSYEGETKAKAAIGKEWNRFKAQGDKFIAEAVKLREFAKTGETSAVKTQLGEVRKACKACHDDFKSSI